jgi:hypothetical protein
MMADEPTSLHRLKHLCFLRRSTGLQIHLQIPTMPNKLCIEQRFCAEPPTGISMQTNIHKSLWNAYGPLMDAKAICKVLYYPSVAALQAAKARGQLPFRPVEIKGRRGLFAMTDEVAELLTQAAQARPGQVVEPDALPRKTAARRSHMAAIPQ